MNEEQRKALAMVQMADFYVTDWLLYMDTHPYDQAGNVKLEQAMYYAKCVRDQYEEQYGPLSTLSCVHTNQAPETPWPWKY